MKAVSINAYEIENDDGETLVFMTPKEFEFIKNNKEKQDKGIDRLNNIIENLDDYLELALASSGDEYQRAIKDVIYNFNILKKVDNKK